MSVSGCCLPSISCAASSASRYRVSASARFPRPSRRTARLFNEASVSPCRAPSTSRCTLSASR
eukprot:scaffold97482_cov28-Tisochrysis_lutea.AAC.2